MIINFSDMSAATAAAAADMLPSLGYDNNGPIQVLHFARDDDINLDIPGCRHKLNGDFTYKSDLFINTELDFELQYNKRVILLLCNNPYWHRPGVQSCLLIDHPPFSTQATGLLLTHQDPHYCKNFVIEQHASIKQILTQVNVCPIPIAVSKKNVFSKLLLRKDFQ
jgi:hypothetical protein